MALQSVRVVLCLFVLSVIYGPGNTQPMFGGRGSLFCDFFCFDMDVDRAMSTTSFEDLLDAVFGDPCEDCPTRAPPTTTTVSPMPQMPFTFMFPPMGMNMTVGRTGNNWFMNFWPFNGPPAGPPSNVTPSPPGRPPAPVVGGTNSTNATTAG